MRRPRGRESESGRQEVSRVPLSLVSLVPPSFRSCPAVREAEIKSLSIVVPADRPPTVVRRRSPGSSELDLSVNIEPIPASSLHRFVSSLLTP